MSEAAGIYLHIPFCATRCHYCNFATGGYESELARRYVAALQCEIRRAGATLSAAPALRRVDFVYFGGGTPSYISSTQLARLVESMKRLFGFETAQEIAFECEPGTITEGKLRGIKDLGVTRLSLGIENFDDEILKLNGRAHLSKEIGRAYDLARSLGFEQINIDLIAGMVGEDWDNWKDCVRKTIALAPESVTIYQMELPYNTTFSHELKVIGQDEPRMEIADWPTKRAWVRYAFDELAGAGYEQSSAYTMVHAKRGRKMEFVYRDSLWHGADMLGTGVASFGHMGGVHMQNEDAWSEYVGRILDKGELPLHRALPITDRQRVIRELILQLKTGRIEAAYFQRKFGVDVLDEFAEAWKGLEANHVLKVGASDVRVTPDGLLQIDRNLPAFFESEYRAARYT